MHCIDQSRRSVAMRRGKALTGRLMEGLQLAQGVLEDAMKRGARVRLLIVG
jgi:hypothetical protein